MLKSEIFTEAFSDFSDCEGHKSSWVDRDFGWEPTHQGCTPGSPMGSLSSPRSAARWQPDFSPWAKKPST